MEKTSSQSVIIPQKSHSWWYSFRGADHQLLADDNAIDLTARLDAKLTLENYPKRFVDLAYKKYAGYPLTSTERNYYCREQKKAQKSLV